MDHDISTPPHRARRPRRALALTAGGIGLALAAGLPLTVAQAAPAAADAPTVHVTPGMPKAHETPRPHLTGTTLIHGRLRIELPWAQAHLLGRSGRAYVVQAITRRGSTRILRVHRDGTYRVLLRKPRQTSNAILSSDGSRLISADYGSGVRTRVFVRNARTGALLARKDFVSGDVVDAHRARVGFTSAATGQTILWNTHTGASHVVTRHTADSMDISSNRVSWYDGDPERGGCTVAAPLSSPGTVLWRSCAERVEAWSPSGRRMLTVPILSDGPGASQVRQRRAHGRLVATYVPPTFVSESRFVGPRRALLRVHGLRREALVSCTVRCVRVSDTARNTMG